MDELAEFRKKVQPINKRSTVIILKKRIRGDRICLRGV
jgi:hypothetical protein